MALARILIHRHDSMGQNRRPRVYVNPRSRPSRNRERSENGSKEGPAEIADGPGGEGLEPELKGTEVRCSGPPRGRSCQAPGVIPPQGWDDKL